MAQINLMPWRQELRQRQRKNYYGALGLVALLSLGIMYLAGSVVDQLIRNQNLRNNYFEQQIAVLDEQIARIKDIKASKQDIEQRMALIEQLQASRNVAPIVMDELAKVVPSGIAFRTLNRKGNRIEIEGMSESNNRLSDFMRRLEQSRVFTQGELSSIVADTSSSDSVSEFKITFMISGSVAPVYAGPSTQGAGQ